MLGHNPTTMDSYNKQSPQGQGKNWITQALWWRIGLKRGFIDKIRAMGEH